MTQAINLGNFSNNLDSSGGVTPNALNSAVPVAKGGTGATTVAGAIAVLGPSLYPVGSIYINAGVATNPATLFGFGTWTAFGAGRVMVGLNAGNPLFDTVEETGGSADAIVVSHTHTASVSDPGHAHTYDRPLGQVGYTQGGSQSVPYPQSVSTGSAVTNISVTNSSTGSSGTNGNYQPYITVYMWKRTA